MTIFRFFTYWALVAHGVHALAPTRVPNTFPLSVFVLVGSELVRQYVVADSSAVFVPGTRCYRPAYARRHALVHILPCLVLGVWSLLRRDGFGSPRTTAGLLVAYLAYMRFDLNRVVSVYRDPLLSDPSTP